MRLIPKIVSLFLAVLFLGSAAGAFVLQAWLIDHSAQDGVLARPGGTP